jgi:hypothetical protein
MLTKSKACKTKQYGSLANLNVLHVLNIHVPFLAIVPGYGTFRC